MATGKRADKPFAPVEDLETVGEVVFAGRLTAKLDKGVADNLGVDDVVVTLDSGAFILCTTLVPFVGLCGLFAGDLWEQALRMRLCGVGSALTSEVKIPRAMSVLNAYIVTDWRYREVKTGGQ